MVKPAVISAILCSILIYTGVVPVINKHAFKCLLLDEKIASISGKIVSSPLPTEKGKVWLVKVNVTKCYGDKSNASADGIITLFIPSELIEGILPGHLFSVAAKNDNSVPFLESGAIINAEVSNIPNMEDPNDKLFYCNAIRVLGWASKISYVRALFRLQFKRLLYAWGDAGGLLLALLSGTREFTDKKVSEAFKLAGLSHILALSGMHLSLFSGLTGFLTLKTLGKKYIPFFSLISICIFIWFAGLSPSLLRALLCVLITYVASFCFIKLDLFSVLSISFLLQLIISPNDVSSAAFILSYCALSGLYFSDRYLKRFVVRVIPLGIAEPLTASIGAQLCTAPVSLLLFNQCRPWGILASLLVSPLSSLFLIVGICAIGLVLLIPFLLYPVGYIIKGIYMSIVYVVLFFARLPGIEVI